ncbi:hypothetical protein AKJ51_03010, partial [candidate division MSBL1 archaeon SCGC-AAA382A20]
MTDKGFWPGIIGGILGFLAGFVAYILGGIGSVFGMTGTSLLYTSAAIAIIFSIIGIISGTVIDRKNLAGGLMIFSGIMVLFATSLYGLLTFILFLVGGIRILRSSEPGTSSGINKKGVAVIIFIILFIAVSAFSIIGDFMENEETETLPPNENEGVDIVEDAIEAKTFSDSGSKVVRDIELEEGLVVATGQQSNPDYDFSNFSVALVNTEDGQSKAVLRARRDIDEKIEGANVIDGGEYHLEVESTGDWTIELTQPRATK